MFDKRNIFWFQVIPVSLVYGFTLLFGLGGNILVILVVMKNESYRSITNIFLTSLATADLILVIFCVPVKVRTFDPCHIKAEDIEIHPNSSFQFKYKVQSFFFNFIPDLLLYGQNYYWYVGLKNNTQKSTYEKTSSEARHFYLVIAWLRQETRTSNRLPLLIS